MKRAAALAGTAWCLVGVTLVMLAILEGTCRILVGPRQSREPMLTEKYYPATEWVKEYFEEAEGFEGLWHPYLYWRLAPLSGRQINIDRNGLRRTWQPPENMVTEGGPPFRIFMFGGSTMWGSYARDDFTIPSQLAKMLALDHNRNVEITNFGEMGFVTTQEVIALLRQLQQGNHPDLAIFYDGVNDVFSAFQNGAAGLPHQEWGRREEFNISKKPAKILKALLLSLEDSGVNRLLLKKKLRRDPPPMAPEEWQPMAREVLRVYGANIRLVDALGASFGFSTLFYWQPSVFTIQNPSPFEEKLRWRWRSWSGLGAMFDETHRLIRVTPGLADLPRFHDISDLFDELKEDVYIDFCHITEEGKERVARRMCGDVLAEMDAGSR